MAKSEPSPLKAAITADPPTSKGVGSLLSGNAVLAKGS